MSRFHRSAFAAIVVLALFALGSAAQAASPSWTIDPNHSSVAFSIRHLFSQVHGTFNKFSGTFVYDPARPESSAVQVEIDASTISTNQDVRDKDLRSDDFFDVAKYPTLTFASTKVTAAGEKKLTVEGNLTMHGVTKPVTLDVTFLGSGKGMMGEERSGFEASTTLNRKDFDIVWNRNLDQGTLLGDDVAVHLSIEGYVRPPSPMDGKTAAPSKK